MYSINLQTLLFLLGPSYWHIPKQDLKAVMRNIALDCCEWEIHVYMYELHRLISLTSFVEIPNVMRTF
jgi:uncharacterized integral membrane protein